jgi:hypothetical protein
LRPMKLARKLRGSWCNSSGMGQSIARRKAYRTDFVLAGVFFLSLEERAGVRTVVQSNFIF